MLENIFKIMREKSGLKQIEIATKLNISQSTVSMWETGDSFPSRRTLLKLSELYDCKLEILFKGGLLEQDKPIIIKGENYGAG